MYQVHIQNNKGEAILEDEKHGSGPVIINFEDEQFEMIEAIAKTENITVTELFVRTLNKAISKDK